MTTALITHADALSHITPEGHPEQVARLDHVLHALEGKALTRVTAPLAADDDILRLHPQSYLDEIRDARPDAGFAQLDEDTWLSTGSVDAAWRAAGAGIRATDMVLKGEVINAFCAMRPPGHHAERETPMGFCLFGNAALAAMHALDHHGLSRVAVVDFDVHHGNGTQALLWDEPRSLFISSHQMPLWPGSGAAAETGVANNVVNLPLKPQSTGAEMRAIYEAEVFPRLRTFAPELLIISAGFDAHSEDPLAELNWGDEDYSWLTAQLCAVAGECCEGRVVSVLEGGYNLHSLARSAAVHVDELIKAGQ